MARVKYQLGDIVMIPVSDALCAFGRVLQDASIAVYAPRRARRPYGGGELIMELKSVEQLAAVHVAQVISYLKASEPPLGSLITFNVALLKNAIRRLVNSRR